jgi:hypothetical protein
MAIHDEYLFLVAHHLRIDRRWVGGKVMVQNNAYNMNSRRGPIQREM